MAVYCVRDGVVEKCQGRVCQSPKQLLLCVREVGIEIATMKFDACKTKIYHLYFGCKVGEQNKHWPPSYLLFDLPETSDRLSKVFAA